MSGLNRRVGLGAVCVALGTTLLAGCYVLTPIGGAGPQVGTEVAFVLNDAGRAALGGSMGPEIKQVQGRLVSVEGDTYTLGVTGVDYLRGGSQTWRGEQVKVKREFVTSVYERHLSKVRSAALGVATVGGIALIVSRGLIGSGTSDDTKIPPDTSRQSGGVRP